MKYSFKNDYQVLIETSILEALNKYQDEVNIPYGHDYHSDNAIKLIKNKFNINHNNIFFTSGGTQTNLLMISYALKHYEGVISVDTGHINVHETAAVEGSGHKIITVPNVNGKLTKDNLINCLKLYQDEHMVKPGMVYISNSTELGTIYTKQELKALYDICKQNNLYFYIDGARLSVALTSKYNDIKVNEYASLCDAFYIGGTKSGLLLGECLVINNDNLAIDFRYHIKNKGALLAKSYLLGIQFEALFNNDLYFALGKKSNAYAYQIEEALTKLNIKHVEVETNQIFMEVNKEEADKYIKEFGLELWEDNINTKVVRIVTSFATSIEAVNYLINFISNNHK